MPRSLLSLMLVVAATVNASARAADAKAPAMLADAPGRGYFSHPAVRGERMVFVADGDLWTTKINGSAPYEAARLTSGAGMESWPVISPDGRNIAFAADYDGNPEIYIMPITGGSPKRLTFHDSSEQPLTFTPDGKFVVFRSSRTNPMGRVELWQVPVTGGPAQPINIGEASLAAIDPATGQIVFTRWSNENWHWKGYRGGTAPDLWLAGSDRKSFAQLTKTAENELFPMWKQGRIWFLSDSGGVMNLWSVDAKGADRTQHTFFTSSDLEPRWASADPAADGGWIVFTRGGEIINFDTKSGQMQALDIRLIGDRLQSRPRFESVMAHAEGFALSPGGKRLAIESRGEVTVIPVDPLNGHEITTPIQFPGRSISRERDVTWLGEDLVAYVSDLNGQSDIMTRHIAVDPRENPADPAAGSLFSPDETKVESSESWIHPPVASLDEKHLAWSTKTGFLRVLNLETKASVEADASVNGAISDYRFSPDSKWLAWSRPLSNGLQQVVIRNLETGVNTSIGEGMTNDYAPRWDPAGLYLYFLSDRNINPTPDHAELNFANLQTTQVCVVPLYAKFPPPLRQDAAQMGMDLGAWRDLGAKLKEAHEADESGEAASVPMDGSAAQAGEATNAGIPHATAEAKGKESAADKGKKASELAELDAEIPAEVDSAGISERVALLPIPAGSFDGFEAIAGGVLLGRRPLEGVLDEKWPAPPLGQGGTKVERFDLVEEKTTPLLANAVEAWIMDPTGAKVVSWDGSALSSIDTTGGEPKPIETKDLAVRVDPKAEWKQIFEEAWRLQRDFFWREDMNGVDWAGIRERYRPLVERIGSRGELNDVIGEMMSELRNSHAYISGGADFAQTRPVSVGSLGADLQQTDEGWKIARIFPDESAIGGGESPLAKPFRNVKAGQYLLAIDGVKLDPKQDPAELLVDKGGKSVRLYIGDSPKDTEGTLVEVTLPSSDHALRYASWVEGNRKKVAELSGGKLGYIHLPDMDSEGLISFMRNFYPQTDKQGLLVDIRDNGGGYISQALVEKLSRKPWAYTVPREGRIEPYPTRVIDGPIVVLMDQGAGSDGDIFPESMRLVNGTTLVGTRTWGGVVGIDMDKGFMDGGISSQPGYGFWTPKRGYKVENEGVTPDIEMVWLPQDQQAGRDTQLERAVEVLLKQMPPKHEMPVRIRKGGAPENSGAAGGAASSTNVPGMK
ncbi:MAG: PDZ domain-containing protein [Planctomycetes bacterium]|nr:PDZ domain-containing protein [Planctomycetota bacterium]